MNNAYFVLTKYNIFLLSYVVKTTTLCGTYKLCKFYISEKNDGHQSVKHKDSLNLSLDKTCREKIKGHGFFINHKLRVLRKG